MRAATKMFEIPDSKFFSSSNWRQLYCLKGLMLVLPGIGGLILSRLSELLCASGMAGSLIASTAGSLGSGPYLVFILFVLVVLLRVLWRTLANYRGTRFSIARTVSYGCVYVAIGLLFSVLSFLDGVPYLLVQEYRNALIFQE